MGELRESDEIMELRNHNDRSDEEDELQRAATEKIQKQRRGENRKIDHTIKLQSAAERHAFIDQLLQKIMEDNHRLLLKQRERIDRVCVKLPTVEVRYQNLCVEAEYDEVNYHNPLPTLWNTLKWGLYGIKKVIGPKSKSQIKKIRILEDFSGIIKPSRMTLLLGPPGCGKTTLLKALAGKLDKNLKVAGDISYNGCKLDEFVPHKTSAYISQYDRHISELTVRETLDFAAIYQGIGRRAEIIAEVSRREKEAGIIPEPDIDTYMKETATKGLKRNLQTDYILKILGLDICADTFVGDAMRRGISGGQKKRLTTGEMMIGPSKVLFMDEISNGLDSSTTFQIVNCLRQLTHITGYTILVSLLQPAPETFELFDDIILMAEGKNVYYGPRNNILEFYEECGFRCSPRKGIADFLQEVMSRKDQGQYWKNEDKPFVYVSPEEFAKKFKEFHLGKKLDDDLSQPFEKTELSNFALSFNTVSPSKWELFKACMAREWLLMRRNSFVYALKSVQLVVAAFITMTVFIRTETRIDINDANYFMGALFYSLIKLTTNAFPELPITVSRLPIFYKHRDFYFYPAWAYSIPAAILKIPFSFLDAFLWTVLTYYVIGYSPEPERFLCQLLVLVLLNQVSVASFRLIASMYPDYSVADVFGRFYLLTNFLFSGFIMPRSSLPVWLEWCFWISPLSYTEIGVSLNEFLAPRWQKVSYSNATIGQQVLKNHGLDYTENFYWVSVGALVISGILLNFGFTCALTVVKGRSRTIISHEMLSKVRKKTNTCKVPEENECPNNVASLKAPSAEGKPIIGMALPFRPMTITFENVQYFVDTPKKMRKQGITQKRLQLLQDITGSFRPGILTALMGVTGAGKTTLLDVLSGRKSCGYIEGDIRIGGYPKFQDTYARISAYCEQTDIHSPQITILESLTYSAWLRLPPHIHQNTRSEFVAEVLEMIELDDIKDALVGLPGVSGISNEQRKRLTIAVELVSNPSIIFMDEPTSGLDARAASIVMRVVKNIVNTRRTIVCTIHQPGIDIFEAFDELILMKRGGQIIYSGELGQHSSNLIQYFENIPGVPKILENHNPATWMIEVSSSASEAQLGVDFGELYERSQICWRTKELVRELSSPKQGSEELHFSRRFPQNGWEQFKACLWNLNLSYWRNPKYNLTRLSFTIGASLMLGAIHWQKGKKIYDKEDLMSILGSMFIFLHVLGIGNCLSALSIISTARTILYRERFAGMYSLWAYSFAQVIIEIPYVFIQSVFVVITYPIIGFYWSAYKVFWYLYTMFCSMLSYTYFGMLFISMTPSLRVASVTTGFFITVMALFSGFLIPEPRLPPWWRWFYWICPASWSLRVIITSQYGDIDKDIQVYGERIAINSFLKSNFGYHLDDVSVAALALVAFPFVCALVFACCMAQLNFQKR